MALVSLVMIGFIAGFFTNRILVRKEVRRVAEMRYALGFERQLVHVLQMDEDQIRQLKPVIGSFAGDIAKVQREVREKRESLIDSLKEAIRPHLTAEQVGRMEQFSMRFRPPEMEQRRRQVEDMRKRRRMDRPFPPPPLGYDSIPESESNR